MWITRGVVFGISLVLALFFLMGFGSSQLGVSAHTFVAEGEQEVSPLPTPVPTALFSFAARPIPTISPDMLPAALYFLQNGQIHRLERDGVTQTQLTQETEPITDFDVSPVDARLVYVSDNRLIEANPQFGTKILKVDGGRVGYYYSTKRISKPLFSPDGSEIAFGMGGINMIPVGETTDSFLFRADVPLIAGEYPDGHWGQLHSPLAWSPDGGTLATLVSSGWEGGGIGLLRLKNLSWRDITSENMERWQSENIPYPFDPTLCCELSWGRDSSYGYITSYSLSSYVTMGAGLTLVDSTSGMATPLVFGRQESGQELRALGQGIGKVFEKDDGTLLSIAISPFPLTAYSTYSLQSIEADGSRITPIADLGVFTSTLSEVLWANDGSGAVLSYWPNSPDGQQELFWVSSSDGEIQKLPVTGRMLNWGPETSPENRLAAAKGERAEDVPPEANIPFPAIPAPAEGTPQLTAQTNLNLRSGPSPLHPVLGVLAAEEPVRIVGVSADRRWWQVDVTTPENDTAWVLGDSDFLQTQNAGVVAVVTGSPPPPPVGRIFYPGWNFEGRPAVFVRELAVGSVPQLVASDVSQPNLATDGMRLAVSLSVRGGRIYGIGVWDRAAETMRVLKMSTQLKYVLPRWSPNGDAIVYSRGYQPSFLYIQPTLSDRPADFIAIGSDPDWHPFADLIAFKGCGETCGIMTMDSQGRQQTSVTDNKDDSRPVWSPDGESIVFMSKERDGNWEIYSVDVEDNVVTRLTHNPAIDGLPVVSPDGRQVAFVSSRGGEWGVWVMPIGGGSPERVFRMGVYLDNWLEKDIDWAE